jgi:ankyrin repeat protein/superfamily II DNA or RNA helicase
MNIFNSPKHNNEWEEQWLLNPQSQHLETFFSGATSTEPKINQKTENTANSIFENCTKNHKEENGPNLPSFQKAAMNENSALMESLLDKFDRKLPDFFNKQNNFGNTILHIAASNKNAAVMELILNKFGDQLFTLLENKNNFGNTILHIAASNKNAAVMELILNKFGDQLFTLLENKNISWDSPLHLAAYNQNIAVMELLLDKFGNQLQRFLKNKNSKKDTVFHTASRNTNENIMKLLLANFSVELPTIINIRNTYQDTILHLAARCCKVDVMKELFNLPGIQLPELLNIKNNNGDTVLHLAARCCKVDVMKELFNLPGIQLPELLKMKNSNGDTILHLALRKNMTGVISLIHKKAGKQLPELLEIKNTGGKTPLDGVRQTIFFKVSDLLKKININIPNNNNQIPNNSNIKEFIKYISDFLPEEDLSLKKLAPKPHLINHKSQNIINIPDKDIPISNNFNTKEFFNYISDHTIKEDTSFKNLNPNPYLKDYKPQNIINTPNANTSKFITNNNSNTKTPSPNKIITIKEQSKVPVIAARYFKGKYLTDNKPSESIVNRNLNTPCSQLLLKKMSCSQSTTLTIKTQKGIFNNGKCNLEYLSYDPLSPKKNIDRLTFVLAGRDKNALVPVEVESKNSRVIIVLSNDQEDLAEKYVAKGRDVLVVNTMDGKEELSTYVTARRFAAVSMAFLLNVDDMIFLDDNIKNIYLSKSLESSPPTWKTIYETFRSGAKTSSLTLLSTQPLGAIQRKLPKSKQLQIVKGAYGSKLTYLNLSNLKKHLSKGSKIPLRELFPFNAKASLEDYFLHEFVRATGLNTGAIDRESLVYERGANQPNLCKNNCDSADVFIEGEKDSDCSQFHRVAWDKISEYVKRNIETYIKGHKKLINENPFNLAQLEHDEEETPKSIQLNLSQNTIHRKKQRTSSSSQHNKTLVQNENSPPNIQQEQGWRKTTAQKLKGIVEDLNNQKLLRKPQHDALSNIVRLINNANEKAGYVKLPTGVGKTRILAALVFACMSDTNYKKRIVVITPQLDLNSQMCKDIIRYQETFKQKLNIVQVDCKHIRNELYNKNEVIKKTAKHVPFVCARSADDFLKNSTNEHLIIFDEVHKIPDSLITRAKGISNLLISFSATPKIKLKWLGCSLVDYTLSSGVNDGYLSPWIVSRVTVSKNGNVSTANDWLEQAPELLKILPHPMGGKVKDHLTFTYSSTIKNSEILNESNLSSATFNSLIINRENFLRSVISQDSNLKQVHAVSTLIEGVNVPKLCTAVVTGNKQDSSLIQILGRLLRLWEGTKKIGYLILFNNKKIPHEILSYPENKINDISKDFKRESYKLGAYTFTLDDGKSNIKLPMKNHCKTTTTTTQKVHGAITVGGITLFPQQKKQVPLIPLGRRKDSVGSSSNNSVGTAQTNTKGKKRARVLTISELRQHAEKRSQKRHRK